MTIADVLIGNINKLDNLKIPAKEIELFNAIIEVSHDLKVCVQAMQEAKDRETEAQKQAEQEPQEQEEPQDEADPQ